MNWTQSRGSNALPSTSFGVNVDVGVVATLVFSLFPETDMYK